ncbi:hypothetical protein Syun_012342 [Stephania yunnanensis]|uniref:Uncharacterized protein n=1 Tax=Stephania yunnanensis TaxID=152371 RepID=A0AAP0PGB5_9MAGN
MWSLTSRCIDISSNITNEHMKNMGIIEKIKEIEAEMARTQKNKATGYAAPTDSSNYRSAKVPLKTFVRIPSTCFDLASEIFIYFYRDLVFDFYMQLSRVVRVQNLLRRGIGVHHAGLLAIVEENEAEVGEAHADSFRAGLVKREELFITTQLWNLDHGHAIEACKDSLKKLQAGLCGPRIVDVAMDCTV